ncbi:MAG TPA: NADH-quinone oxidoreductase subunit M [Fimbriimonadaceae bacterium]|nr:NADH-quinone oxidoreductase subunit M [Fimbriimonadaceae bacterium]HVM35549.1 NADH-quinone oxidoreductase subunit M [Actinomycetota bacterium]
MPDELLAVDQVGFPVLSLLLLFPVVAAAVVSFLRDGRVATRVAVAAAALEFVGTVAVALAFEPGTSDMQFVERTGAFLGVSWHVGVDGVSVLFVPLTALLGLMVIAYAEHNIPARRSEADPPVVGTASGYSAALLLLEATMLGAFISLDLVIFWFFFVAELIPSWFLITRWGTGPQRLDAARNYVGYVGVGAALMLIGIVLTGNAYADATGDGASYELGRLSAAGLPPSSQTWPFVLFALGLAAKAPLFPFHTWLPKVLDHGPVVGMSVFLVGVKLGTYGFLRFVIPLFPDSAQEWLWVMAVAGAVSVIYGSFLALGQTNLRRLLAFASVAHMGVVMLGLFSLNLNGFEGALLQMINLGIVGAGLFFIAGFLTARIGQPELGSLGGLVSSAPLMTTAFLVVALAGIGLPGTNGFNGEHLVMLGGYQRSWWIAVIAGLGVLLTAAYSLSYFMRGFMGEPHKTLSERIYDLTRGERAIVVALAALIFWIGLGTSPFIHRMRPSLTWLEQRVEDVGTGVAMIGGRP